MCDCDTDETQLNGMNEYGLCGAQVLDVEFCFIFTYVCESSDLFLI